MQHYRHFYRAADYGARVELVDRCQKAISQAHVAPFLELLCWRRAVASLPGPDLGTCGTCGTFRFADTELGEDRTSG